jgi:regulator of cell morphogenesis and NO signaling
MLTLNKTVREVALELPQATRVFEKLQIDYCCGGERPLPEACAVAGVDLKKLESLLQEARESGLKNEAFDLQAASLGELIKHILDKHHVFTRDEMTRLQSLIEKVIGAHGRNHLELLEIGEVFESLCLDLRSHMLREEQILFPYIVAVEASVWRSQPRPFAPFGTVSNPVRMMMMEHDSAGDILRKLRALTSDYTVPADACLSYESLYQALEAFEEDLHQHIHLENNILFPRAVELESQL